MNAVALRSRGRDASGPCTNRARFTPTLDPSPRGGGRRLLRPALGSPQPVPPVPLRSRRARLPRRSATSWCPRYQALVEEEFPVGGASASSAAMPLPVHT